MKQILISLSLAAFAADFATPVVGYSIQVEARQVRLILGIPGATHYSDPIAFPPEATAVQAAPGHRWMLAQRDSGASLWIPETNREVPLSATPDRIAFSPTGSAVALYNSAQRRLIVYSGLPDAPSQVASIQLPFDAAIIAIDGQGQLAAAADPSGALRLVMNAGAPDDLFLCEARPITAFGFFSDAGTLAIADGDSVELISGLETGALARRSVRLPAAVTAEARFAPAANGAFLLIDPGNSAIHRIEGASVVRTATAPMIAIARIETLRTRGAALLGVNGDEIPRIVVSHSAADDVFYLPTEPREQQPEEQKPEEPKQ